MFAAIWSAIGILATGMLGIVFYLTAHMDSGFARMEARFDAMGARLDSRIDALSGRLDAHLEAHGR
jgi:hypothetical protein